MPYAIPKRLDLFDLKGGIVTIDAMGFQKKIAAKITEKESDYVFSLKEKGEWANLNAGGIVRCHKTEKKTGKKSTEMRFSSHR